MALSEKNTTKLMVDMTILAVSSFMTILMGGVFSIFQTQIAYQVGYTVTFLISPRNAWL